MTSTLVGGERSTSRPGRFNGWIRGWVGSMAGMNGVEKREFFTKPGLEL
jgi:hypothetical protein